MNIAVLVFFLSTNFKGQEEKDLFDPGPNLRCHAQGNTFHKLYIGNGIQHLTSMLLKKIEW